MSSIQAFDPATTPFADLRPRLPVDAALCLTTARTTELGGGFVRLHGPMVFDVTYDEALFVIAGTLRLRRGAEEVHVAAGTSALVAAGAEVAYEPVDAEPVLFFFARHPRE